MVTDEPDASGPTVLVVNAGSSSLKLRLLDAREQTLGACDIESWEPRHERKDIREFLAEMVAAGHRVDAVGHRIVHGGAFDAARRITPAVRARLVALTDLAPLHQGRGVAGIDAVGELLPGVPAIACFDTAFHARMPAAASTYALPAGWRRRWSLRRYGFHGLSHGYIARRTAQLLGRPAAGLRIVSCHLGAGASLAAIQDGRSVDTTMGFTPLEGLVMATRSGSVDPGLLLWLLSHTDLTPAQVEHDLQHAAGLAGLAGGSGDLREVHRAARAGDARATLALEVYVHRLRREIAAMTAALGGLDALVFTGGVGEHDAAVRSAAAAGLAYLGVRLDPHRNHTVGSPPGDVDVSAAGASVRTLVVAAREDLQIARETRDVLRRENAANPARATG